MADRPKPPVERPSNDAAYAPMGDLRSYVAIVRRRKWSLFLVVAITVAAAGYFSYRQIPMYRASATVLVKPLNPDQILTPNGSFGVSMPTQQPPAASPAVRELAQEKAAELGAATGDTGTMSAKASTDTPFLELAYAAPDAAQAQVWAQAYAEAYMEYRTEQAKSIYDAAQAGYQKKVD